MNVIFKSTMIKTCRSQRSRGLRRRSTAARLLRSWVRIPPGAYYLSVVSVVCVSGRRVCDGLITRPRGVLLIVACRV
jgi:hypothetical protein